MDLNASVEDPRIMGVIREQGGKVKLILMGTWGCRGACLGYLFMFYVSRMPLWLLWAVRGEILFPDVHVHGELGAGVQ